MKTRVLFNVLTSCHAGRTATPITIGLFVTVIGTPQMAADGPPRGETRQSVVLLNNGETLSGWVTPTGDRLEIRQEGARINLPRDRVRWVGESLVAVYQYQQRHLSSPSVRAHLRLSSWCLEQQLYEQAIHHFTCAKKVNPKHPEIESVRQRLLHCLASDVPPSQDDTLGMRQPRQAGSAARQISFETPSISSVTEPEISKSVMRAFTLRVQPLLVNRCAMSGCHGANSTNSFQLLDARRSVGLPATMTRQNLHAVLQQVHSRQLDQSPLLEHSRVRHGTAVANRRSDGSRKSPEGPLSVDQLDLLRQWIAQLSNGAIPTGKRAQRPFRNPRPSPPADPFDPGIFNAD